jgi:hypothetical protein
VEWITIFFFVGLFMVVHGVEHAGLLKLLAEKLVAATGGSLAGAGSAWVSYWVYAPTRHARVTVRFARHFATATFAKPPRRRCRMQANKPFAIDVCGVLVLGEWRLRLPFSARAVVTVGAEIRAGSRSGPNLGYYLFGLTASPRDPDLLIVHLGFKRPPSRLVMVRLSDRETAQSMYSGPLLHRWFPLRLRPVRPLA